MKICFLDNNSIGYYSSDIYSNKIRGAENILINLSLEFSKLNHKVTVYNNCNENLKINNINWINLNNINDNPFYDLAISNNDIRLFDKINAQKKVVISHSIQSIEKFIRKNQLFAFLQHKPKIVLLSEYHKMNRSYFLSLFGSFKTDFAVDNIFLEAKINQNINKNQAIFTSHSDRNLDLLVNIWKEYVYEKDKSKNLLITPIKEKLKNFNIFNREFSDKIKLINDISNSRFVLIPGHKAELFCISAEEARELCVPVITLGIGCLKERVEHGKTGLIANSQKQFADYIIQLFNDDNMWNFFRKNLFELRGSKKWQDIAKKFLNNV